MKPEAARKPDKPQPRERTGDRDIHGLPRP